MIFRIRFFAPILTLALCFILAACGHRNPVQPLPTNPTTAQAAALTQNFVVTRPRFGENHPVNWNGTPPSAYPVHGVDISVWQGQVDWATAHANGVNFVYLKATEGGDHLDPAFLSNWKSAAAAGVPRGAYHFFYHCRPAVEQARWFIANVPRTKGALPPVLDVEWTPRSPTCPGKRPAQTVRSEAQIFLNAVHTAYGKRPILYTTLDFYKENELWRMSGVDFWLRSVAAQPSDSFPGQHWLFWQYSGTGGVPGISGPADLDAFAGSSQDFQTWIAGNHN